MPAGSIALLALVLVACAQASAGSTLSERVDAILAPLVEAHEFSGAVVLLRGGEVVYQRGFGSANHDARIPFTPETASDGGSLAKTLTAAGIWWLAQEGRIKLDAPATDYVPGYPHAATTVRQLIAHSNGLPWDYATFDPHFAPDQPRTTEAMLDTGDLNAFYSFVYWDRARNESVAYVSNSTLPPWRRAVLARELIDALSGTPARISAPVTFERFTRETQGVVAGTYLAANFGPLTISKASQGLRMRVADGLEYDLFQVTREVFYAPGLDYWLAFRGGSPPAVLHLRSLFVDTVLNRATAQ